MHHRPTLFRAMTAMASRRPRRTAALLLVAALALLGAGLSAGGRSVAVAFLLAVPALGAAYALELRRLWGAAGRAP